MKGAPAPGPRPRPHPADCFLATVGFRVSEADRRAIAQLAVQYQVNEADVLRAALEAFVGFAALRDRIRLELVAQGWTPPRPSTAPRRRRRRRRPAAPAADPVPSPEGGGDARAAESLPG